MVSLSVSHIGDPASSRAVLAAVAVSAVVAAVAVACTMSNGKVIRKARKHSSKRPLWTQCMQRRYAMLDSCCCHGSCAMFPIGHLIAHSRRASKAILRRALKISAGRPPPGRRSLDAANLPLLGGRRPPPVAAAPASVLHAAASPCQYTAAATDWRCLGRFIIKSGNKERNKGAGSDLDFRPAPVGGRAAAAGAVEGRPDAALGCGIRGRGAAGASDRSEPTDSTELQRETPPPAAAGPPRLPLDASRAAPPPPPPPPPPEIATCLVACGSARSASARRKQPWARQQHE